MTPLRYSWKKINYLNERYIFEKSMIPIKGSLFKIEIKPSVNSNLTKGLYENDLRK